MKILKLLLIGAILFFILWIVSNNTQKEKFVSLNTNRYATIHKSNITPSSKYEKSVDAAASAEAHDGKNIKYTKSLNQKLYTNLLQNLKK